MTLSNRNIESELVAYMRLPYAIEIETDQCGTLPCFMAVHPELYGCMAEGASPQEAVKNLEEARREYIEALLAEGIDVPLPNSIQAEQTSGATYAINFGKAQFSALPYEEGTFGTAIVEHQRDVSQSTRPPDDILNGQDELSIRVR